MSRVIKTEGVGKERNTLCREIVLAIRELMKQSQPDETSRDIAAFIALALEEIAGTIDASVTAWEKRGYWVKADRFRMDWAWTDKYSRTMVAAVQNEDWGTIAVTATQVAQKFMDIKIPERHRLGTPWVGAWQKLRERHSSKI